LGPKGTGKSHIYSDFSPHGILISGGEVTVPKLFVNNATGKIGLVGYWDVVAFDEFAGKSKKANRALVDILKNYMANKSFSRGIETLGAEASMVYVGNTQNNLLHMLMHTDLFEELPKQYYDSAFLDRIHFYIPGWEVEIIRGEMFTDGYGFVVDYLAEILRSLRNYDYSQKYEPYFSLSSDISTRDRDGVNKTFSGLMKIIFPEGEASEEDIQMLLEFAMEGRKRVKDQLMRIDPTYTQVNFAYQPSSNGQVTNVETLEEAIYPQHYYKKPIAEGDVDPFPEDDAETEPVEERIGVEQLISLGESDTLEFKSTMRWNLYTDKKDKRIEHSALKTIAAFLNTVGGTLLIGVADDGKILGIEADHFENDDRCLLHVASLINDKMGAHYNDLILRELQEVDGKKILRVDCHRSPTPIYLEDSGRDELYIRTGPSTVALSAREVIEYSKKHF
jgi:hypothetical protein